MKQKHYSWWVTVAGLIGISFGVFYTLFGLEGLPVYEKFVSPESFEGWSRGLYGASFIGFSVLLLLVGRRAVQQKDRQLGNILLYGIAAWLAYEGTLSLVYGVYINIVVDMVLMACLSYPILKGTRRDTRR